MCLLRTACTLRSRAPRSNSSKLTPLRMPLPVQRQRSSIPIAAPEAAPEHQRGAKRALRWPLAAAARNTLPHSRSSQLVTSLRSVGLRMCETDHAT